MAIFNDIKYSEIKSDRFDAEYYRKDYIENINLLNSTGEVLKFNRLFKYIKRGSQPVYSKCGSIKVLRSVNVGKMSFNETRQEYVDKKFFDSNIRGQVKKDDILITSTGVGTLGRVSIWPYDEKAYCDGHITILRNSEIDPYFMTVFLNTKFGEQQFDQNFRGSSGQIEIYPYDISKFILPEFLLKYQKEIGDLLRRSFELQNQSVKLYQEAELILNKELGLDKLNIIKPKTYITTFTEVIVSKRLDSDHYRSEYYDLKTYLNSNFHCERLHNLSIINRRGIQPVYIKDGNLNIVNSKHLSQMHIKYNHLEKTSMNYWSRNQRAQIKVNDLLIYTTGAYVGLTNVYLSDNKALASNHVNILRIKDPNIDTSYIALVLNSVVGKLQTNKFIRGSAQAELYPNEISKFIIPILDTDIMKRIGGLVRESLICSQDSKHLIEEAKKQVEDLIENQANQN